mgnify:FL=1
MPIRILSDDLINQISAGEVVERPANIVKELIENSIDSNATKIEVFLRDGGLQSIIVNDNGNGIKETDLPIAILRYATSKLKNDNLNEIQDFGFRGEALPAISSISNMTITSKKENQNYASRIEIERGEIINQKPSNRDIGTTVEVASLFEKVPARLKFLKTNRIELSHCKDIFLKIALSHPNIEFKFNIDGKNIYDFKKNENNSFINQDRLIAAFGDEFLDNSLDINYKKNGYWMYGKISYPTFNSSTTSNQYLYVNKRSIKDKKILGAIKASYSETIPKGRFPFVIIFLEISPSLVDVNVHPSKTEVRFENDRAISGIIVSSIRSAISESVKSVSKNFEKNLNFTSIDPNDLISNNIKPDLKKSEETFKDQIKFNEIISLEPSAKFKENSHFQAASDYPMGAARAQFLKNYIISETKDGIVIVDQHAAHERIVKEEMLNNLKNKKLLSQILLIPEIVKLSSLHLDMIIDNSKILESAGFEVEIFGDDAVLVRAIPDILNGDNIQELIRDVAQELFEIGSQNSIDQKIDTIISTSSCYGSVRSGRDLSIEEMNALLRKMEITPNSNQCNHGRPTSIKISLKDIEKLFKRR